MIVDRKQRLETILNEQFAPRYLEVLNESHRHQVPVDSETHFKVSMVSSVFANCLPLARHRMVYRFLNAELSSGLHALSLHLYTEEEWQRLSQVPLSPLCAHAE